MMNSIRKPRLNEQINKDRIFVVCSYLFEEAYVLCMCWWADEAQAEFCDSNRINTGYSRA